MQWYYVSDRQERIPVTGARLGELAKDGVVRAATLVWRKGLASWVTCGELWPEWFGNAVPAPVVVTPAASPAPVALEPEVAPVPEAAIEPEAPADVEPENPEPEVPTAAVPVAPVTVVDSVPADPHGLMTDVTTMLNRYTGWLTLSGAFQMALGIVATAIAGLIGVLAWRLPERLEAWHARLPEAVQPLLRSPAWTVVTLLGLGFLFLAPGAQLVATASHVRRASRTGDPEELRTALRSLGDFFRNAVLIAVIGLLLVVALLVEHFRHREPPAEAAVSAQML